MTDNGTLACMARAGARTSQRVRAARFGVDAPRHLQHLPGQLHVAAVLLLFLLSIAPAGCILVTLLATFRCLSGTPLLLLLQHGRQILRPHGSLALALGIHILLLVLCTPG